MKTLLKFFFSSHRRRRSSPTAGLVPVPPSPTHRSSPAVAVPQLSQQKSLFLGRDSGSGRQSDDGGGYRRDDVKVVIINTQYVEIDATSFKSVVQQLTGKEYSVATAAVAQPPEEKLKLDARVSYNINADPLLSRGWSFKEFDRMFKDLPPLEELYRLCP